MNIIHYQKMIIIVLVQVQQVLQVYIKHIHRKIKIVENIEFFYLCHIFFSDRKQGVVSTRRL
jgi:hypothetical protein